jgi:hypothetical protein
MRLDRRNPDAGHRSDLRKVPTEPIDEHHRDPLPFRQLCQRFGQAGFDPHVVRVGWDLERDRTSPSTRPALSDSIEIADGVLHPPHLLPVLPPVRHRFCCRLPSAFQPVRRYQRAAKARFLSIEEDLEGLVGGRAHY